MGGIILASIFVGTVTGIAATEIACPGLAVIGGIVTILFGILELVTGTAPGGIMLLALGAGVCLGPLTSSLINHVFE